MADRIRFHLDEHIDPDLATALRTHGIDVSTTFEVGLRTQSDELQWRYVVSEARVLITSDADFLRIAALHAHHPWIVFCTNRSRSMGDLIRTLILIYEVLSPLDIQDRVEFV